MLCVSINAAEGQCFSIKLHGYSCDHSHMYTFMTTIFLE